jgi:hypothetical protein
MNTGDTIQGYRVHVVHDLPQAGFQIVEATQGQAGRSVYALLVRDWQIYGRSYRTTTFRRPEGHYGVRTYRVHDGFSYYNQAYVTTLDEAILVLRGAAILLETLNDPS